MRAGDFSAEQYAEALLSRCGRCRSLNAFITLEPDHVLIQARECDLRRRLNRQLGPLHGLPIPVKDSINTCQFPTTAGTSALRHFQPTQDADVVTAIRRAGAIVLGKTNMHELSFGWTSDNRLFARFEIPTTWLMYRVAAAEAALRRSRRELRHLVSGRILKAQ